jgi:plastocyanin
MERARHILRIIFLFTMAATGSTAQTSSVVDVSMRLTFSKAATGNARPSAVFWLNPLQQTPAAPFLPEQHYTLMQKNRMFKPHLLIIPVGGVVQFPNADPFFHNVFSLYNGKRFDLGLYEAGSTKSVTFSREGVSYIFCNIHPEMSAVILTIATTLFAKADSHGVLHLANVPPGDYEMHIWIEGVAQPALNRITRRVHLTSGTGDLGTVEVPADLLNLKTHTNMFGQPYERDTKPTY